MKTSMKRGLIYVIVISILLISMIFTLASCGEYKIDLIVDGQQSKSISQKDLANLDLGPNPVKENYDFQGWYTDNQFKNKFDPKAKQKNKKIKLYAKFVPIKVDLNIDGKEFKKGIHLADLNKPENNPEEEGLEFRKWYIDKNYQTLYTGQKNIPTLYAVHMAKIEYDNGYEILKTNYVMPETLLKAPELSEIVKDYMDPETIEYYDESGLIDFNKSSQVLTSKKITVRWATPHLKFKASEKSDEKMVLCNIDGSKESVLKKFPAISLPSHVVMEKDGIRKDYKVENVDLSTVNLDNARVLLINDGIKHLKFGTNGNYKLEKIVMPDSLLTIEDTLWYSESLKEIHWSKNLEVLRSSFNSSIKNDKKFDLPSSVTNYSRVGNLIQIPDNHPNFVADGSAVYSKDKSIFIGDTRLDEIENYELPNFVKKVQVDAFLFNPSQGSDKTKLRTIKFSDNFEGVSYNNSITKYQSYEMIRTGLLDIDDPNKIDNDYLSKHFSCFILNNLEYLDYISFNSTGKIEGMNDFAVLGGNKPYTDASLKFKVVYRKQVEAGNVTVSVKKYSKYEQDSIQVVTFEIPVGEKLTKDYIIDKLGGNLSGNISIIGSDYKIGDPLKQNIIMEFVLDLDNAGFTYEEVVENGEKEYVVTGFDETTAKKIADSDNFEVSIPTDINGVKITKIKTEAFKDNQKIARVVMSNIIEIGDRAFSGCKNLQIVKIVGRGLESIGESAFEDSTLKGIIMPFNNLKNVGEKAFFSKEFCGFTQTDSNKKEQFRQKSYFIVDYDKEQVNIYDLKVGNYYLLGEATQTWSDLSTAEGYEETYGANNLIGTQIAKYKGSSSVEKSGESFKIMDFELNFGCASGYETAIFAEISLGVSDDLLKQIPLIRYELMPNSVYMPNKGSKNIMLCNVSKAHKGSVVVDSDYLRLSKVNKKDNKGKIVEDESGNPVKVDKYTKIKIWRVFDKATGDEIANNWISDDDLKNKEIFNEGWIKCLDKPEMEKDIDPLLFEYGDENEW